ncbi:uncharacterized protein METZ01_LOCUS190306 [marine metagenome]|uniref:MORN repeat-containing protein n=1 Tax=marine metagenome TaxID=408172 RepID=A0A382DHC9_9ZZZZ
MKDATKKLLTNSCAECFVTGDGYGVWCYGGRMNGLHHGNGTITHANGKTLKGIWENDKFKSARD